jgi:hypothetical protein
MKVIGIIGAAALSLLLVIAGPVYAQQDQQDEKKGHLEQSLEDIRASSTAATGSLPLTRVAGYWGNDWYDHDDVYIIYVDNGYYLYNQRYPSVGIAINISL